MFRKLAQLIPVAALAVLASCAHRPANYDVQVGQPQAAASHDGKLKAGGPSEAMRSSENVSAGFSAKNTMGEPVEVHPASAIVEHKRPDKKTGKMRTLWSQRTTNVKTTAGIDFVFAQAYGASAQANGFNYILCSNDSVTETSASTTLSNEITTNGLARAKGTYAHTTGASTATITYTFTASGAQSVQKCALSPNASGTPVTHILGFTQRSLQTGDTLAITFTITISALPLSLPYQYAANDNGFAPAFAWKHDEREAA